MSRLIFVHVNVIMPFLPLAANLWPLVDLIACTLLFLCVLLCKYEDTQTSPVFILRRLIQVSICVCPQPMRDDVTTQSHLSLAHTQNDPFLYAFEYHGIQWRPIKRLRGFLRCGLQPLCVGCCSLRYVIITLISEQNAWHFAYIIFKYIFLISHKSCPKGLIDNKSTLVWQRVSAKLPKIPEPMPTSLIDTYSRHPASMSLHIEAQKNGRHFADDICKCISCEF